MFVYYSWKMFCKCSHLWASADASTPQTVLALAKWHFLAL
jgi:hypothetical protein